MSKKILEKIFSIFFIFAALALIVPSCLMFFPHIVTSLIGVVAFLYNFFFIPAILIAFGSLLFLIVKKKLPIKKFLIPISIFSWILFAMLICSNGLIGEVSPGSYFIRNIIVLGIYSFLAIILTKKIFQCYIFHIISIFMLAFIIVYFYHTWDSNYRYHEIFNQLGIHSPAQKDKDWQSWYEKINEHRMNYGQTEIARAYSQYNPNIGSGFHDIQKSLEKNSFYTSIQDYEKSSLAKSSEPKQIVMMCISGGGSRSAYFAAATLHNLYKYYKLGSEKRSILEDLEYLSTVSGGSVAGSYYCLHSPENFKEKEMEKFFQEFKNRMKEDIESQIWGRLLSPCEWGEIALTGKTRTHLLAEVLDKLLGPKKDGQPYSIHDLYELRKSGKKIPILLLNATVLNNKKKMVFSEYPSYAFDEFGTKSNWLDLSLQRYFEERPGKVEQHSPSRIIGLDTLGYDRKKFPLALGVASSAAFPVGFDPLRFPSFLPTIDTEIGSTPYVWRITDGGVYDNFGLNTLLQLISGKYQKEEVEGIDRVILLMIDGEKPIDEDADLKGLEATFEPLKASLEVVEKKSQHLQERVMVDKNFSPQLIRISYSRFFKHKDNLLGMRDFRIRYLQDLQDKMVLQIARDEGNLSQLQIWKKKVEEAQKKPDENLFKAWETEIKEQILVNRFDIRPIQKTIENQRKEIKKKIEAVDREIEEKKKENKSDLEKLQLIQAAIQGSLEAIQTSIQNSLQIIQKEIEAQLHVKQADLQQAKNKKIYIQQVLRIEKTIKEAQNYFLPLLVLELESHGIKIPDIQSIDTRFQLSSRDAHILSAISNYLSAIELIGTSTYSEEMLTAFQDRDKYQDFMEQGILSTIARDTIPYFEERVKNMKWVRDLLRNLEFTDKEKMAQRHPKFKEFQDRLLYGSFSDQEKKEIEAIYEKIISELVILTSLGKAKESIPREEVVAIQGGLVACSESKTYIEKGDNILIFNPKSTLDPRIENFSTKRLGTNIWLSSADKNIWKISRLMPSATIHGSALPSKNYPSVVAPTQMDRYIEFQWYIDICGFSDLLKGKAKFLQDYPSQDKIGIAIIDDGIETQHEDLKILLENCYSAKVKDWEATEACPNEKESHGTACAGLIFADSNEKGICGLGLGTDHSTLYSLKLHLETFTSQDVPYSMVLENSLEQCILESITKPVKIINISYQLYDKNLDEKRKIVYGNIKKALRKALEKNICVVIAAGNRDRSTEGKMNYLSLKEDGLEDIIVVGGIDGNKNGVKTTEWSTERDNVDIYAGAMDVLTCDRISIKESRKGITWVVPKKQDEADKYYERQKQIYAFYDGTSFAAPMVTAAIAWIARVYPGATPKEIKEILVNSADFFDGIKILNAYKSVEMAKEKAKSRPR